MLRTAHHSGQEMHRPLLLARTARARLIASIERWADRYAAATIYEQLSKLSDAELARRGLSRDILARDL